jgi:hypothetical protein
VALGVLVKRGKHNWQNDLDVVANEIAEVFVVPEVQRSLGDLEMRAGNRFGELMEQWLLDLGKLCRVHDLENILDFVEKHDFLGAIDLGPVT